MALAFDTKGQTNTVVGEGPQAITLTLDATVKLLVIGIVTATNTAGRSGTPTWNTTENFTQIGSVVTGYKECQTEMWYLLNPTSGSHSVNVPCVGIASGDIRTIASSYKGATACELDQSTSTNGSGAALANPSLTLNNVPDGSAVVDILGDGYTSVPSGNSGGTLLYSTDEGAWDTAGQYLITSSLTGIINEDMSVITEWTDQDQGDGNSSQVTFDSKSCMKLDSGISTGAAAQSGRLLDIGSFQARTVFSFSSYCDAIGTQAQADYLEAYFYDGATCFYVIFCSDGVKVYDGVTYNEVGTDLVVQDSWQEWKFDVNWTAQTVDVYLGGILQASGVDCSWAQGTAEGTVRFNQRGYTTANRISYVDWFKAGDGALITATLSYTQSEDDVAYIMASFNEVVSETPVTVCPGVMYLESA